MDEDENLNRFAKRLLLVVGICALVLVMAYAWTFHNLPANESPPAWGAFGDFLGGILNPVISSFTLFVAVNVWSLQKSELSATKRELETQRGQQRFFDLLNIYHRTLDAITTSYVRPVRRVNPTALSALHKGHIPRDGLHEDVGDELVRLSGREALKDILTTFEESDASTSDQTKNIRAYLEETTKESFEASRNILISAWIESLKKNNIGHYFRTLSVILEEAENLLGEEHRKYVGIFVSQLSDSELLLLAYHLLLDADSKKISQAGIKYGILRNLEENREIFAKLLREEFFRRPLFK